MEEQKPLEEKEQKEEPNRAGGAIGGLILGLVLGYSIFASSLGPHMNHVRELAKRAMCAVNLNGIGKCMVMYQADHEDVLPPNLHTLVLEVEAGLKMFACPSAGTERSPTTAPADFREHCDYIFTLCSQPADLPSDLLCGYELPLNHTQWFVNRLYYDMHVAGAEDMNEFRGNIQKVNDFLAEKRGGGQ